MRYRSFYVCGVFGLLVLVLGAAALALVRYERGWYVQAAVPPGPLRQQRSEEFYRAFSELISDVSSDGEWYGKFTDEQINSYLEEGFVQSGLEARVLPECISHPRLSIEPDKVRLAFRYGSGAWSSVVSIDLRVWLARREPNVMCLELEGFHVGALPIAVQSILERISEAGRQNGVDVAWYRNPESGHPVAVLRFQAEQQKATLQLLNMKLDRGSITIQVKSSDGSPVRAMLPQPLLLAHDSVN